MPTVSASGFVNDLSTTASVALVLALTLDSPTPTTSLVTLALTLTLVSATPTPSLVALALALTLVLVLDSATSIFTAASSTPTSAAVSLSSASDTSLSLSLSLTSLTAVVPTASPSLMSLTSFLPSTAASSESSATGYVRVHTEREQTKDVVNSMIKLWTMLCTQACSNWIFLWALQVIAFVATLPMTFWCRSCHHMRENVRQNLGVLWWKHRQTF